MPPSSNIYGHSGDLGDIVSALPTIRALGGGHLVIGYRPRCCRETMEGRRYRIIEPLLEEQPYIAGVRWVDDLDTAGVTHDFSTFRKDQRRGENLAQWQARHFGVTISEEPWLTATPDERFADRTIIARSSRYHEVGFPWPQMLTQAENPCFVGLPMEHQEFSRKFGPIEYTPTDDLWQLARMLRACKGFIGNQSSAWWLAIGLGVDTIQETYQKSPDSRILRPNAKYYYVPESRKRLQPA